MKWLFNTYDPFKPDAKSYITFSSDETQEQAWAGHLRWLLGKVIGEPQATSDYTTDQLRAWGYVGVYKPD